MKWYISAEYQSKTRARALANRLRDLGEEVTANWLWAIEPEQPDNTHLERIARGDLGDVLDSDRVVLLTKPRHCFNTNGRIFEAGFAYGHGIPLVVIGPKMENCFTLLADEHYDTEEGFLEAVKCELSQRERLVTTTRLNRIMKALSPPWWSNDLAST